MSVRPLFCCLIPISSSKCLALACTVCYLEHSSCFTCWWGLAATKCHSSLISGDIDCGTDLLLGGRCSGLNLCTDKLRRWNVGLPWADSMLCDFLFWGWNSAGNPQIYPPSALSMSGLWWQLFFRSRSLGIADTRQTITACMNNRFKTKQIVEPPTYEDGGRHLLRVHRDLCKTKALKSVGTNRTVSLMQGNPINAMQVIKLWFPFTSGTRDKLLGKLLQCKCNHMAK